MDRYYLIREKDGHEHLVLSLDGHPDAKVLEEDVTAPRIGGCVRKDGRWRIIDKDVTKSLLLESQPPLKLAQRLKALEDRVNKAGL